MGKKPYSASKIKKKGYKIARQTRSQMNKHYKKRIRNVGRKRRR